MGLEFVDRVMKASLVVGAIAFLFVSVYFDWRYATGLFVGCAWGVGNLYAIKRLVLATIRPGGVAIGDAIFVGLVKFPVLYGMGFLILWSDLFSPVSLVIGFTLIFAVIILKALGRMFIQSQKSRDNQVATSSHGGSK